MGRGWTGSPRVRRHGPHSPPMTPRATDRHRSSRATAGGWPRLCAWTLLASALLARPGAALDPADEGLRGVLRSGEALTGIGRIQAIRGLAIDDAGRSLVLAEIDGPGDYDEVLLLDRQTVFAEGDAVPGGRGLSVGAPLLPLTARVSDLRGFPYTAGRLWAAELEGVGLRGTTALLRGARPLAQAGDRFAGIGLPPGAAWRGIRALAPGERRALVVGRFATGQGRSFTALVAEAPGDRGPRSFTALLRDGDRVPGAGRARLAQLSEHPRALAAAGGHWLAALELTGDAARSGALLRDGQLLRRDGDPHAETGLRWAGLAAAPLALASDGSSAWFAQLADADRRVDVLVRDGQPLARVGRALAELPGHPVASFGAGRPVAVGPGGRVVWRARLEGLPEDEDEVLCLGTRVLLREGDRLPDGGRLGSLGASAGSLALAPGGRWLLVRARRWPARREADAGTPAQVALRIDLGLVRTLPSGDPRGPRLSVRGGRVAAGESLQLEVTGGDRGRPRRALLWVAPSAAPSAAPWTASLTAPGSASRAAGAPVGTAGDLHLSLERGFALRARPSAAAAGFLADLAPGTSPATPASMPTGQARVPGTFSPDEPYEVQGLVLYEDGSLALTNALCFGEAGL